MIRLGLCMLRRGGRAGESWLGGAEPKIIVGTEKREEESAFAAAVEFRRVGCLVRQRVDNPNSISVPFFPFSLSRPSESLPSFLHHVDEDNSKGTAAHARGRLGERAAGGRRIPKRTRRRVTKNDGGSSSSAYFLLHSSAARIGLARKRAPKTRETSAFVSEGNPARPQHRGKWAHLS